MGIVDKEGSPQSKGWSKSQFLRVSSGAGGVGGQANLLCSELPPSANLDSRTKIFENMLKKVQAAAKVVRVPLLLSGASTILWLWI